MTMDVVDAHQHLWDPARRHYPWLTGDAVASIRRPYALADLQRETTESGVSRTILVQTVSDVTESLEFLDTAAHSENLIAG